MFSTTTTTRIDQHADRDRKPAEAHQIGGHSNRTHGQERNDDRERQAEGDHQRCAPIAQEQQQQDDHQHGRLAERPHHRADGATDEAASVIEHVEGYALGQRGLQLLELCADVTHELAGIGSAQAQHQPFNRFALAVLRHRPIACQGPDLDARNVVHAYRDPVAGVHDNGLDVVDRADAAFNPHQGTVLALVDAPRAVVAAVGFDGAAKQLRRNAARGERIVERDDLERPHVAAEGIHVGNPGNRAQRRSDHPVEQGSPFRQRQLGAVDGKHEHLAERTGDRRKPATHPLGKVTSDVRQPLGDLVARPVDIRAVLEIDRDVGERVFSGRAKDLLVRQAQQFELDRDGDALLDLLRRQARCLHDDFHLDW
ncbi:hypothetical protein ACVIJX_002382 [Bradyrhizobium diazoefficiens]